MSKNVIVLVSALVFSGTMIAQDHAAADSISIGDRRVENVLVSKTSSFYYVQIPREGRTINIPVDEVDAGSVVINNDPFYRDKLKEEYETNRAQRAEGKEFEVDPAFSARGETLGGGGGSPGGGAASGGGLGTPRTQVEKVLAGFGLNFQPGPAYGGRPSVVANLNGVKFQLVGPPEQLFGIVVSATAPPPQIEMMIAQQKMFVSQLSAEAGPVVSEAVIEAKSSGYSKKSLGEADLEITYKQQGEMVDYAYKVMARG